MKQFVGVLTILCLSVLFNATSANSSDDLERRQHFYYKIEKGDEDDLYDYKGTIGKDHENFYCRVEKELI